MKATINFTPGSEWQREVAYKMLVIMLTAFATHFNHSHKKNNVEWRIKQ